MGRQTGGDEGYVAESLRLAADGALTIEAACAFSGLSRSRIYELLASGDLASTYVGCRRLILRASLVALLARGVR